MIEAGGGRPAPARLRVRLALRDGVLVTEVADDGRGGADPAGSGLIGLRRRVEALDGTLSVVPTRTTAACWRC